ncbi:hypothetical protein Fmac_004487 [Flemingia macrophylla]|uniref:Uncharacterized protein n=1 Tax=Flemingia macrophylla TaxID=520843 RepID=A0ABD1N604_9FABA
MGVGKESSTFGIRKPHMGAVMQWSTGQSSSKKERLESGVDDITLMLEDMLED